MLHHERITRHINSENGKVMSSKITTVGEVLEITYSIGCDLNITVNLKYRIAYVMVIEFCPMGKLQVPLLPYVG